MNKIIIGKECFFVNGISQEVVTVKEGKTIQEKAASVHLTPKERLVLDYILKNPEKACFMTAAEISEALSGMVSSVSASSVVRVSAKLQFENFTELKKALQWEVAGIHKSEKTEIPYTKISASAELSEEELISNIKENVLRNIKRDQSAADQVCYKKAAALIEKADRVFLVGFRACAGFADSLGTMLGCVRPNVQVINGHRPLVDSLVDLTERDVLLALSFERYSKDTIFAVKMAVEAGCSVVALTDSYTAPICSGASSVIVCSSSGLSFYNSYASLVMAMEVLTGVVSHRKKEQNEKRLRMMERYLDETGQY